MNTKPVHEETSLLRRENHGAVELLTLNRAAKLNALNGELLDALMRAMDELELDSAVRVVVITGAGRAFSASADIAGFRPHLEAGPREPSCISCGPASS